MSEKGYYWRRRLVEIVENIEDAALEKGRAENIRKQFGWIQHGEGTFMAESEILPRSVAAIIQLIREHDDLNNVKQKGETNMPETPQPRPEPKPEPPPPTNGD